MSSFRGRVSTSGRSRCVSSSGPETRPYPFSAQASQSNVRWLSQGAVSAEARAPGCPASSLAARLARRSRSCAASSSRRGCWSLTSLPEPGHEPAKTKLSAAPSDGTRSGLRAALRPANSVASRAPSIDRRSCARRAHVDGGAGHRLVSCHPRTTGPPNDRGEREDAEQKKRRTGGRPGQRGSGTAV